ncbi:hypothetical protein [Desulfoscipio gibsoniae]|uniref:Uncharacterized protein n=1 Tax=Desulfoscipio gibsoniae DSM 7213 TaxID=767817 RepID=R4KLW1_9FIRM|nr:hypothetical protein [Desulfoscipio gibsoniae]AGL00631.1 hypothetical protein Desgi_1106 [Desulfoscipio gibsoniae DSM 7213]
MVQFDTGGAARQQVVPGTNAYRRESLVKRLPGNLQILFRNGEVAGLPGSGVDTVAILHQDELVYRAFISQSALNK